ncbi:reverse transcriptase domain-containing protein [Tanacetum coccineum]
MVFHQMDTKEVSDRFVSPCFVNGLKAYGGEINLGVKENMISNEYAVKLCLEHEVKRGNKVVKKELIVALRGEIYFLKFIINPEEDDVEPEVIFGRSFLRITKVITDFGAGTVTIYPEFDPFMEDIEEEEEKSLDDWDHLLDFNLDDIPLVKLDRKVVKEEEEAVKRIKGEALKEKDDLGAFIFPIRLEGHVNENALADTGSDINTMPYRIYEQLRIEKMKKVDRGITMINHTQAEAMGILTNVLCQVGVTTLIAKFLILDIPIDRDAPIVVGQGFLRTISGIVNTLERLFLNFDGFCHQPFRAARSDVMRNAKSDSDDEEEYEIKRNKFGASIYGPNLTKGRLVPCSLPVPLKHVNWKPDYKGSYTKEEATGQWRTEIRLTDPEVRRTFYIRKSQNTVGTQDDEAGSSRSKRSRQHETVEEVLLLQIHNVFLIWEGCNRDAKSRYNTRLAQLLPRHVYSSCVVNWDMLNRIGYNGEIDDMLRIRLREAESNEEIFTSVAWIKAFNINEPIYAELCHEFYLTYEFDEVCVDDELQTKKIIKFRLGGRAHNLTLLEFAHRLGLNHADELEEDGFNVYFEGGLRSDEHFNAQEYWLSISREENLCLYRSHTSTIWSPILRVIHKMITYGLCQRMTGWMKRKGTDLDTTPLRDLIDSEGKLIPEDPRPGVPRVGIPRPLRASMQDLYQGVFEHMARVYSVPLQGAYNPPSYAQP